MRICERSNAQNYIHHLTKNLQIKGKWKNMDIVNFNEDVKCKRYTCVLKKHSMMAKI